MVILLDQNKDIIKIGNRKEKKVEIKTIQLSNSKLFDSIPTSKSFHLLIARYDEFSESVQIGYEKYEDCTILFRDENKFKIDFKYKNSKFCNMSELAEVRTLRIEAMGTGHENI